LIEPEDLMIPRNISIQSDGATAETITARLSQLESRPVIGAYDATHLRQIHTRLFEGVFPWAGKLREPQSSELTSSLDLLFDRLARENRLKGLDRDAWSKRSTEYFRAITVIEPFINGNKLASLEFFRQLAGENNMRLRYLNGMGESPRGELQLQLQQRQSNNLRRILMLAVDPYPTVQPSRVLEDRNILELITPT
jgi:fido (protein-threonine AMPylation protein)